MTNDLISRSALLAEIDQERKRHIDSGNYGAEHLMVHSMRRLVEDAPDVACEQWISVKERLPDNDDYYLTYTTEYTCEVYRYDGDGEWVTAWDDTENHDITHWMPLPEPPKEVRQ